MRRTCLPIAVTCVLALLAPSARAQAPTVPPAPPSPPPVTASPPTPPAAPAPPPSPAPQPHATIPEESPPPETSPTAPPASPVQPPSGSSTPTPAVWWDIGYRYPGAYSTSRLLSLTDDALRAGLPKRHVTSVSAPFIVAGYARFWDSWGEIRHADVGLRPHLGQDVFCDYDAPLLAAESGTLEYGHDASGGLVARVHIGGGRYWYYAHMSRFEPSRSTGDRVEPGDVVGYCGTSGNAAGTPPHVHFSYFVNHVAQNPMGALIGWLHRAEAHAMRVVKKLRRKRGVPVVEIAWKPPLDASLTAAPSRFCFGPVPKEPIEMLLEPDVSEAPLQIPTPGTVELLPIASQHGHLNGVDVRPPPFDPTSMNGGKGVRQVVRTGLDRLRRL